MDDPSTQSPVTLVIRAPNQRISDQTLICFLDWSVEKLKKHISNVYPSKPLPSEQRLVYSGGLLQDHQQLGDVLRQQDEYHMLHLVCAPRHPPTPTTEPAPLNADSTDSTPSVPSANQDTLNPGTAGDPGGLRFRGGSGAEAAVWSVHTAPPAGFPPHAVQMLWWQRMYAQQYYMQYHAAMAASQAPPTPRHSITQAPAAPLNPVPEEEPANEIPQMNAQGGLLQNEEELNRDWLDWLYTVARAAMLLSVVYFYSSFSRFVMVIGAMLLLYLHQVGWFPFRADQNPAAPEQPPAEDRNREIQEMERVMDDGIEDAEGGDDVSEEMVPHQQSFFSSTWSFISTFFTSLVPDGPQR